MTRSYGRPQAAVEALQMGIACRAYMREGDMPKELLDLRKKAKAKRE